MLLFVYIFVEGEIWPWLFTYKMLLQTLTCFSYFYSFRREIIYLILIKNFAVEIWPDLLSWCFYRFRWNIIRQGKFIYIAHISYTMVIQSALHNIVIDITIVIRLQHFPGTRTVSSLRQSTLWTGKCSPHYAIKMCNNLIFICYHLHPSTSLHLILFYSILSSIAQLYIQFIYFSIFVYLYLHVYF